MTNKAKLNKIIEVENIKVYDFPMSGRNKGFYIDNAIAISDKIESEREFNCILAEEIGHHKTSYGNILDLKSESNSKQEYRARAWAFKEMIMLPMIIEASKQGVRSRFELADYLDVTEDFLQEAIDYFKGSYGLYKKVDNYIIYFEPLGVMEIYEK